MKCRSGIFFSKALLEEEEFEDEWREKSIVEDYWKAENYRQLHKKLRQALNKSENGRILFDTVFFFEDFFVPKYQKRAM